MEALIRKFVPTLHNFRFPNADKKEGKSFDALSACAFVSAVGLGVGLGIGVAKRPLLMMNSVGLTDAVAGLPFASLSLADSKIFDSEEIKSEPKTGLHFPLSIEDGSLHLAGLGVRNKVLFGLKNLKIYAFGLYTNPASVVEKLGAKYGSVDAEKLKSSPWLLKDLISEDVELSVRLVIYYRGLKIGQVRNAFEDSLGSGIKRISGAANPQLLNSFTSQFKDDFKLERGTSIQITRKPGHVLVTTIGGEEVGRLKSSLMAQAFFDLYIGESPFDKNAKQEIVGSVAGLLSKA